MVFAKNYETPQQQDGVGKYVYLHPWAFWSFGPSGLEFDHDARFCCSWMVFWKLACMALWKWFLQRIASTPQQNGVGKYVYLHPWAFWSFGPSGQEFGHDARFCCSWLVFWKLVCMAFWKWFLQRITSTPQQDGVDKYVYLHPSVQCWEGPMATMFLMSRQ